MFSGSSFIIYIYIIISHIFYIFTYIFYYIYIMAYIPEVIFSRLLYKYLNLWCTDGRRWCKVQCEELADRLTNEIYQIITAQTIIKKLKGIRLNLRRLDSRKGTDRRHLVYRRYAHTLELVRAAQTMTDRLIGDVKIRIVTIDDGYE